jgi:hypothetical protein
MGAHELLDDLQDTKKPEKARAWGLLMEGLYKGEYAAVDDVSLEEWKRTFDGNRAHADCTVAAASLRLLGSAVAAHPDGTWSRIVETATRVAQNGRRPSDDLTAWGLYILTRAKGVVSEQEAQALFGLLESQNSKVRQWVAFALGELCKDVEFGHPDGSRFEDAANNKLRVESMACLMTRWKDEIDVFVQRDIVIALASAGHLVKDTAALRDLFDAAAKHRNPVVWVEAPRAIQAVAGHYLDDPGSAGHAGNVVPLLGVLGDAWFKEDKPLQQTGRSWQLWQHRTGPRLLDVVRILADLTKRTVAVNIPDAFFPFLAAARWVFKQQGFDYETGRAIITAMEDVLPLECAQATTANGCADAVKSLMDLAAGAGLAQETRLRTRALQAIAYLGRKARTDNTKPLLDALSLDGHTKALRTLVRDSDKELGPAAAEALTVVLGETTAADFYVEVILDDGGGAVADSSARRLATSALGSLPGETKKASIERLATAIKLQDDPLRRERARIALTAMGGADSVKALVGIEKKAWVQNRYFNPMHEMDAEARKSLKVVQGQARVSFWFTHVAASVVVAIGIALAVGCLVAIFKDAGTWTVLGPGIAAVVTAVGGMLVPFFFNPASAVQRACAEMTRVITAFMGYSGRMRLLGLGFAAEYTKDSADLAFLKAINEAAGSALADSCNVLGDVAVWPGMSTVEVPDLVGKDWDTAVAAAKPFGLQVSLDKVDFSEKADDENKIVKQTPPTKSQAVVGTVIKVVISKGKKESAATTTTTTPS